MTTNAAKAPSIPQRRPRLVGDLITLAVIFGLLGAVYLLPADTSLSQLQAAGRLIACMPDQYPPLVTGDPEAPGFEVELLNAIASKMDVGFSISTNSAIGRDFNPANWRVTRAQCSVLAGGVVISQNVRSFLDTIPTPLSTGWAVVSPNSIETLEGATVGFFAGLTGLDRTGLGQYLREVGAQPRLVRSIQELEAGLRSGEFQAGVSEALGARQLAGANDWDVQWMPQGLERFQLGFGIWRGDLTLSRAIDGALETLKREGFVDALLAKYKIAPIERTLGEPA